MSRSPASNLNTSPLETVLLAVSAAQASKFPLEEASNTPTQPTLPHVPVAVANSAALELVAVVGSVPLTLNAHDILAYDPPETSVPPPVSEGAAVKVLNRQCQAM